MKHLTDAKKSDRLQRILGALSDRSEHSTFELMMLTKSCAIHSDVDDLRNNGYQIDCKYHGMEDGRRIYKYRLAGEQSNED